MDRLLLARRPLRRLITKTVNEIDIEVRKGNPDVETLTWKKTRLQEIFNELGNVDNKIKESMLLNENVNEDEFTNDIETVYEYKDKYFAAMNKIDNVLSKKDEPETMPRNTSERRSVIEENTVKYKLPKIEIKKYNGERKEWLSWWAQFEKIHENPSIDDSDKFHYLIQSLEKNSKAAEAVKNFQITKENYPKAIEILKNQFGNPEILRQLYIRELLKLVIQNQTQQNKQVSLFSKYHNLESHLRALESLGTITRDELLYPLVESSLPNDILIAWQRSLNYYREIETDDTTSDLSLLRKFLQREVENEDQRRMSQESFLNDNRGKINIDKRNKDMEKIPTAAGLFIGKERKDSCLFCSKPHESKNCANVHNLTYNDRKEKVNKSNCCYICLRIGHPSRLCKEFVKCLLCNKRHHTILCNLLDEYKNKVQDKELHKGKDVNMSYIDNSHDIYLQTLQVKIVNNKGIDQVVRVLLDSGAQRSYIKTSTAENNNCKKIGTEKLRQTLFGGRTTEVRNHTNFEVNLKDVFGKNQIKVFLLEQPTVCGNIPKLSLGNWVNELRELDIKVPDLTNNSKEIQILIGMDYYTSLLTGKIMKLKCGLMAIETKFGWIVCGQENCNTSQHSPNVIHNYVTEASISNLWELDLLGIKDSTDIKTEEEEEIAIKEKFNKILKRDETGRYSVSLPWKEDTLRVINNRNYAEKRLLSATKKLVQEEKFRVYDDVFKAWLSEGIIEEVNDLFEIKDCYYLPHRLVFKPESLTTPVRPVFDASCKLGKTPSLNDHLFKGLNNLDLIPSLINRFREKEIGFVSDIRKAFLMIGINEEDRDFLRFLWWKNESRKDKIVYRHVRVVFGLNCSPYLLSATIEKHLKDVPDEEQEVAMKLLNSLYVDNCISSCHTLEEYERFKKMSVNILARACMDLRQWESTENADNIHSNGKPKVTNVLGLIWNQSKDTISIKIPEQNTNKITKRNILSATHCIFDPIGVTCPVMIYPKLIIQETWVRKIDWDEELDTCIINKYNEWLKEIQLLKLLEIPRQIIFTTNKQNLELHIFCDASIKAYAAVVFVKSICNNEVYVNLIQARNRVTPIKQISIPRLELLACLIGLRLANSVKESLNLNNCSTYYWSDSTTVLAWTKRHYNFNIFVKNRVEEIMKFSKSTDWQYVPSHLNPADLPSRGCNIRSLLESRWWEGPEWLRMERDFWPQEQILYNEEDINKEVKNSTIDKFGVLTDVNCTVQSLYTSYIKTIRVWGWILRFFSNCRRNGKILENFLSIPELLTAEMAMIKRLQSEIFPKNVKILYGVITENVDGILCTKTKLLNEDCGKLFIRIILLPKNHAMTELLIEEIHKFYCHAGVQFIMGKIREKYWIPCLRKTITRIIRKCVTCRRYNSKKIEVEPAKLQEVRTQLCEPYSTTGVDLAGPLYLKNNQKVWIVLYTCAVYRCVHLDLVTSLSTEEFLKCLERFIHLNGRPNVVMSDNGTNFVGSCHLLQKLDWDKIQRISGVRLISWRFNPPTASWWGGWWERLIRTTKDLLKRILGKAILSFEEMRTCLTSIQAVINDRPLTTLTEDVTDLIPLKPSMFLRGLSSNGYFEGEDVSSKKLQNNYRMMQDIKRQLRQRFHKEYLNNLIIKAKRIPDNKINVGDIVLIGIDNKKRYDWPLGKIEALIKGRDNVIRVAKVKTQNVMMIRPLQRIYPLEVSQDIPSSNLLLGIHSFVPQKRWENVKARRD